MPTAEINAALCKKSVRPVIMAIHAVCLRLHFPSAAANVHDGQTAQESGRLSPLQKVDELGALKPRVPNPTGRNRLPVHDAKLNTA